MAASISKALTRNLLRRSGDITREVQLRFCSAATSAAAISAPETQPAGLTFFSLLVKVNIFPDLGFMGKSSFVFFAFFPPFSLLNSGDLNYYIFFLNSSEKNGPSRLSKLLLFVPGVITFGLGTWQIIRRQEKVKS